MNMKWMVLLVTAMVSVPCLAEDRLELDQTQIQGARELPKVLYIVPWKKTSPDEAPVQINSMVDEVMAPVDREVLKRQLQFYDNRKSATAAPSGDNQAQP
jgi:hypothetical protein